MPAFDLERSCIVVRIVYDGPALAGKTTNLKQICSLFPVKQRSEMYTPGSLKGRTMFFDWLEIDGGKKGKHAYRFQLLTVPGQVQRNYRRRPLLQMADAVVFVCDCSPESIDETKRAFAQLRTHLRARQPQRVPLIVQANKQDAPGALSPADIAHLLRLDETTPVLPAVASTGTGVRDTIVAVVRAAARQVQQQIADHDIDSFEDRPGSADDLFMAMLDLEDPGEETETETGSGSGSGDGSGDGSGSGSGNGSGSGDGSGSGNGSGSGDGSGDGSGSGTEDPAGSGERS